MIRMIRARGLTATDVKNAADWVGRGLTEKGCEGERGLGLECAGKTVAGIGGSGEGTGIAYGAATIVNAMPSGYGGAVGVCLRTLAKVKVSDVPEVEVEISGPEGEGGDDSLAKEAFRVVMEKFGLGFGGHITTVSEIPPARGMKSSSAASNAIVLATLNALGRAMDEQEVVRLGVIASRRAGVTLTGAFDDACASLFGGVNLTDNHAMRIMRRWDPGEGLRAVFLVPDERRYSGAVDAGRLRDFSEAALQAFGEAMEGRVWRAMLINGLLMARAFGSDPMPILEAVREGALSAGLSGKGPAYCAITTPEGEGAVLDLWKRYGHRIITTQVRRGVPGGVTEA